MRVGMYLREKPRLTALITAIGISFALLYGFQLDIGFLPGAAPRAFPERIGRMEELLRGGGGSAGAEEGR
jgi:branched-chain amino acid transport system permease protein